jgi:hypothetical protein
MDPPSRELGLGNINVWKAMVITSNSFLITSLSLCSILLEINMQDI